MIKSSEGEESTPLVMFALLYVTMFYQIFSWVFERFKWNFDNVFIHVQSFVCESNKSSTLSKCVCM